MTKIPLEKSLMEQAYLCPPGNGVFTVSTAKERKDLLHELLYGCTGNEVEKLWRKNLAQLPSHQGSILLGICSDCGGGILRGANWGPLFVRTELYSQHPKLNLLDLGDIRVIPHLVLDKYLNQETITRCKEALYQNPNSPLPVSPLSIAMNLAEQFYEQYNDKGLISLGGDHSISFPLVKSFLRKRKQEGRSVALIHFDAHTDIMEERLGIDICFGSWVYHILSDLPSPHHLYQIGIRNSGADQNYWESKFGIQQFWAREIQKRGAGAIADDIIKDLKNKGVQELYVSFDIDSIDQHHASATGTPETGGPSPDEIMLILTKIQQCVPITSADLVEVAPFIKHPFCESPEKEPQSTLAIASRIVHFFITSINEAYSQKINE